MHAHEKHHTFDHGGEGGTNRGSHFSVTDDKEMMECMAYLPTEECYLNLPSNSAVDNPLDMEMIKEQQDADDDLLYHCKVLAR